MKQLCLRFIENEPKNSFVQNPIKWLKQHPEYDELKILISDNLVETKKNIFINAYGPAKCKSCGRFHFRLLAKTGWRGWAKTCSEECENLNHSERQKGTNNSSLKMSDEEKLIARAKQSETMKLKIMSGDFTPKSSNYLTHGMISFSLDGEIRKVRSLWELIFWLKNPHLKFESLRLPYFDSIEKRTRIYIADFFDEETNTVYEIKPRKYQNQNFLDKRDFAEKLFTFITIDETYFEYCKTSELVERIKECVHDFNQVEKRLKWLRKV